MTKRKSILAGLILILVLFISCGYFVIKLCSKQSIKLDYLTEVSVNDEVSGKWWSLVRKPVNTVRGYYLDLPDIDYNQYNLIISGGRKIDEMWYREYTKYITESKNYHKNPYIAEISYQDELTPHTVYVYRIKKLDVNIIDVNDVD
ncbi:hypothetical protein AV654_29180 [Paenibacillus elgii]|uniref:Uncharacterized protein n=1 Tax=Paenibacillus elgii TaxID=189691 RepID=A0A163V5I1_9BACL|nr:hypothetical protein [Paenibacillus elgii]KZE74367.1 hypothetical protein AV654_29180 [Paenibacillus elgii]